MSFLSADPWRRRARDPVFWTDVVQLVKTVLAATVAWVLATYASRLEQAFLAPWSALLVVNATVYRTLSEGGRQVGATVLGVLSPPRSGTRWASTWPAWRSR